MTKRMAEGMKLAPLLACFLWAIHASASTGDETQFQAAFAQVKIGMTLEQVRRLGQEGDRCADWPHQRPPVCGPLHYFRDKRTVETTPGTTIVYSYGREEIVFRNGVVVQIHR